MDSKPKCIYCNKTREEVPLFKFLLPETKSYICAEHLPIIIHKPEKLMDVMPKQKPESED